MKKPDGLRLTRELARDAARAARDRGYRTTTTRERNALKSYLLGTWKAIATHHPGCAPFKAEFFKAAGVSE